MSEFAAFAIHRWHSNGKTYHFVPDDGVAAVLGEKKRILFWISQELLRFIGVGRRSKVQSRLEFKILKMGAIDNGCMEGSKNLQLSDIPTGKNYFMIEFYYSFQTKLSDSLRKGNIRLLCIESYVSPPLRSQDWETYRRRCWQGMTHIILVKSILPKASYQFLTQRIVMELLCRVPCLHPALDQRAQAQSFFAWVIQWYQDTFCTPLV